jgi:hypothetical protein
MFNMPNLMSIFLSSHHSKEFVQIAAFVYHSAIHRLKDIPVVDRETLGSDCFNLSVKAKKIVVLDKITR